jgi:DNA-binding MarR family transcriptional regulator
MIYEEELLAGNGFRTLADWRTRKLKPSALKALRALAHHEQALTASQLAGEARLSPSTAREIAKAFVAQGYAQRVSEKVSGRNAYMVTPLGQEAALAAKIIAAQDEGAKLADPALLEKQEILRALAAKEVTMREIRSMRAKKRPGKHRVVLGPNGERAREMVGPHRWSDPWHVCKSCGRHHTLREHRHHKHDGERYRVSMGGALFPGDPVPKDPPFEFTMFNPGDLRARVVSHAVWRIRQLRDTPPPPGFTARKTFSPEQLHKMVGDLFGGSAGIPSWMLDYADKVSFPKLREEIVSSFLQEPNPRRSRPWAQSSTENRTPIIPFEVFRDQEFMPIWRRAVASGKIPPEIIQACPTLMPNVMLTEQLTQLHCKNSRRYAQVIPNRLQFEFALQTLWLPAAHRGGLIAHEIGHVLAPEGSEDDADRAAHKVLGIKITYDKRWPGKGLQKGRVVR